MQVILTKDVEHLGAAGELVQVRPGYGRNYLIPRGLALIATRGNVAQLEHQRRTIEAEQAKLRANQEEQAKVLRDTTVSIARKVGQDEKLFGSVTAKDIVEALAAQNLALDRRLIRLPEPIKTVGAHEVEVRFSATISAALKVNVVGI
ncbi:MAG: 50S ribosomal protein L9 [Myxococcales bacterium FL481]|nr:MAG: 50S ribosomal protein L9 [Myxococcales bacterium FL481]